MFGAVVVIVMIMRYLAGDFATSYGRRTFAFSLVVILTVDTGALANIIIC